MNPLLVAMGERLPAEVPVPPQPQVEPLEELVLELTDLKFVETGGVRRASALARLVHEPATVGQRAVASPQRWPFVAPIGPIELEELRWYFEEYAVSPRESDPGRARRIEENLSKWGRLLHEAGMPIAYTANVMKSWGKISEHSGRRFSVLVEGANDPESRTAKEVAMLLHGLPWELLHDGDGYLFQGAKPICVRRRLPNIRVLDVPKVSPPIRILLVSARPEDDACRYVDHRASSLPLVEATEQLGGLVYIHLLSPPTLPALRDELARAHVQKNPYHVIHFDGHGLYDHRIGLGAICFEDPEDVGRIEQRRHIAITTNELRPLLRDFRVPLVLLGAFSSITLDTRLSDSIASELLELGTVSVVAMSHQVLVESLRRFVQTFYRTLAQGARVGDGMLQSQCKLKDDSFRGWHTADDLRIEDWFVPVLFQEKDDPQLFKTTPVKQTVEDFKTALGSRLGNLPTEPVTGFIGRSRELLALERLLRNTSYSVVRGQGGEGKTALATEFARWMVRSQQIRRASFVSVETHGHVAAVLDALGHQLVGARYSVAAFGDLEKATLPIERALREQATLLVVDNMESILLPPYLDAETPDALSEEAGRELKAILALCERLSKAGDTRLVFTSREALPAPFDGERNRRELHRLDREDAVKLIERGLNAADGAGAGAALGAARETIEVLVDTVAGHARTLTLLAPSLRDRGVEATREALVELMAQMERQFPGSREKSVFASVELSLRRMSSVNRDRAHVLGVFHGAVDLDVLSIMMEWKEADVGVFAGELIQTGLATPNRYNHLTLNPALSPYLRGRMESPERDELTARWVGAMRGYVRFLVQQQSQSTEVASTLTGLELPNLFALLDRVERAGDAEATIDLATSLYSLLQNAGKPRHLERVGQVRHAAAGALEAQGDIWSHARFEAARTRIEQQLATGRIREAFDSAKALLERARAAGSQVYPVADYDLAMACWLLARVLETAGGTEQALPLLDEARERFEGVAKERPSQGAERMASVCFTEQGNCFHDLGRLDEAAAAYEEGIRRAEQLGASRDVAVGKGRMGTVRLQQRRYPEALAILAEARERFTQLGEPGTIAGFWQQTGRVHQEAGQPEAAEDAYRKSLAIEVRLGSVGGQASTLIQLGNLYDDVLDRPEEAAAFYRQAAGKYVESRDPANEGRARSNLAKTLRRLRRLDEAREEIQLAIECDAQFGHASEQWKTWAILADIETDAGNPAVAAEAKGRAVASYLAYRRDGGENHYRDGRISLAVTQHLLGDDSEEATALLQQLAANPDAAWILTFLDALQAIVTGSRDRTLAEAPELDYTMAAEILFLIETLEKAGR